MAAPSRWRKSVVPPWTVFCCPHREAEPNPLSGWSLPELREMLLRQERLLGDRQPGGAPQNEKRRPEDTSAARLPPCATRLFSCCPWPSRWSSRPGRRRPGRRCKLRLLPKSLLKSLELRWFTVSQKGRW